MKKIRIIFLVLSLCSCNSEKKEKITSRAEYGRYLTEDGTPSMEAAFTEIAFWNSRLNKDSTNIIELNKLSGLYSMLYSTTGDISALYKSEALLKKAHTVSARNKDSYLRSLAHNYISQHRFKEAKKLLDSAYAFPDNKRATEFMLFDVSMELGDYAMADIFLGKVKNDSDYNYLIRLAKWSDHIGDLDSAIRYMEQAKTIAESSGTKSLKIWIYTNIADYYGHAGRVEDAYKYFLMALQLQPDNAYAKKGIAWIVYAIEKNTLEANRILDSIMGYHKVPDYYLLKAEMAKFDENPTEVKKQQENFINAVNAANYGGMYNTYLIELYAETNPEKALLLAEKEIENRATADTYQLLAYAQLQVDRKEEALITIETYVVGKTYEPKGYYYTSLVYKANGLNTKLELLKKELLGASFELGPVLMRKVDNL
jgi:tetratricopeptide (TPR) repeat protein